MSASLSPSLPLRISEDDVFRVKFAMLTGLLTCMYLYASLGTNAGQLLAKRHSFIFRALAESIFSQGQNDKIVLL